MSKTTEEKIDDIHDAVLTLNLNFNAFKESCATKHAAIDNDIAKQSAALFGNGRPGIISRFDKFETRFIAYTIAAMFAIQALGPKVLAKLGW